jgi:glutathione synthase
MKKNNKIVAIQGDALQTMNPKTDTTLLLALEAQKRNYKIYYYETKNLTFLNNDVYALSKEVEFKEDKKNFYSIKGSRFLKLSKANFVLM